MIYYVSGGRVNPTRSLSVYQTASDIECFLQIAYHVTVHCLLRKQVDGSSMALLGNTQDDDMRLIAEMTISRLQAISSAVQTTTQTSSQQSK